MSQTFRFSPGEYRIRPATSIWEQQACFALRRAVFCDEQQLFERDDRDLRDITALPLAAMTCLLGEPEQVVGTVRIDQRDAGIWFGSRLAVQPEYRYGFALGHRLIQHAVATARALGAQQFFAHVQLQNVPLFQRLHWRTLETTELHGQPHQLMQADFDFYPVATSPELSLFLPSRPPSLAPLPLLEAA